MGYRSAEEVTLPARFLTTTAHFVAVLTILFDVNTLAGQVLLAQSEAPLPYADSDQQALASQLRSAAYVAVACFAIEFVGLFAGVSLFMRGHACLYILAHFVGTIIIGLLYTNAWGGSALVAAVVVFNVLPAALELLTFAFVARISFLAY